MSFLFNLLMFIFFIALYLNYQSLLSIKNSLKIINDMGMGYNLGQTFNNFSTLENENSQNDQIKMWGTELPKRKMINKIKKYGFKTIRLQVISMNSMNISGMVSSEWILGIKEVVDWVINSNMYCILSIFFEGNYWQRKNIKKKYINFWIQIANEFIEYDEHLILESMTEFNYSFLYEFNITKNEDHYYDYEYYYMNFLNSTQDFINTIRNSGGFNKERLLVIPGITTEVEIYLYSLFYKVDLPIDPSNKLAVSLNYVFPSEIYQKSTTPMEWYERFGLYYATNTITEWGSNKDYKDLMKLFDFLKSNFINIGIPVIIGQVGIITEKDYDINSLKEFLYVIFSLSSEINGLMSCLWDISEKIENSVYYYNKEENIWTDEQIRGNFVKISKRKYINSSDYYFMSNSEIDNNFDYNFLDIDIGTRKVTKVIINARLFGKLHEDFDFGITTSDRNGL